ncbi:MAG: hypothetical protein RR328_07275, partial [Bacteroidales bacterium]
SSGSGELQAIKVREIKIKNVAEYTFITNFFWNVHYDNKSSKYIYKNDKIKMPKVKNNIRSTFGR